MRYRHLVIFCHQNNIRTVDDLARSFPYLQLPGGVGPNTQVNEDILGKIYLVNTSN